MEGRTIAGQEDAPREAWPYAPTGDGRTAVMTSAHESYATLTTYFPASHIICPLYHAGHVYFYLPGNGAFARYEIVDRATIAEMLRIVDVLRVGVVTGRTSKASTIIERFLSDVRWRLETQPTRAALAPFFTAARIDEVSREMRRLRRLAAPCLVKKLCAQYERLGLPVDAPTAPPPAAEHPATLVADDDRWRQCMTGENA